jgi:hypothetical protein
VNKIMGKMAIESMLEMMDVDGALRWHLQFNHYPPLPGCVFSLAKQAIKLAENGKWESRINLTKSGISWHGQHSVPVSECIEEWHLENFININENMA